MKRALLISCVLVAGCKSVSLEGESARAFACDHNNADAGQCSTGWSCGFDDRCFERAQVLDGGQLVEEWRCAAERHCPSGWQCGQEVDATRTCQQLGVGAPSPCADNDGGCQGGWRCGAGSRCFDPSVPDGGTARECAGDAGSFQCPNGFTCGELVKDRGQHCVELDVEAPSDCNTDHGCQGRNRCDTFAHLCVEVTDVITTGQTTTLTAVELSPRRHEAAPLMFAMTRFTSVSPDLFPPASQNLHDGIVSVAAFADGGLRVTAQFSEESRGDGGPVALLYERNFAIPGIADVTDLVSTSEGPAVRFRDGGASRLWLRDGGWQDLVGSTDFLRQRDPLEPQGGAPTSLVRVVGNQVSIDGTTFTFGGRVNEVVASRGDLYAFTDNGFFRATDAGTALLSPITLTAPSRGAVAGFFGNPQMPLSLGVFAEVLRPGGLTGAVAISELMGWTTSPPYASCPDGGSPLQHTLDVDDDGKPLLIARCTTTGSGSFPVQALSRGGGMSPVEYRAVIQDQTPFQWGVIPQRASPFVRAHAGTDGRMWYADDQVGRGILGRLPLRPVLLERQPEGMISFFDVSSARNRVFAEAGGDIFVADPYGGFVSQFRPASVKLISLISSRGWIIANTGLLAIEGGLPRMIATVAPESFSVPATGVPAQLQLSNGLRDVVLVASGDSIWFADVTDAQTGTFAQPAVFTRVLVPVPGVPLRSMALEPAPAGSIKGFFTTSTKNFRFGTTDLVRWTQSEVPAPAELTSLPLEVWGEADGGAGRTGFSDGRVWSLPIMVPLTAPLVSRDGGALIASDFARKCGDVFAVTSQGLFRAERSLDGGLPAWTSVSLPVALDSTESLRLYETRDDFDRLFIGTHTGQVVEVTGTCR